MARLCGINAVNTTKPPQKTEKKAGENIDLCEVTGFSQSPVLAGQGINPLPLQRAITMDRKASG
jgi:hypothetical protein